MDKPASDDQFFDKYCESAHIVFNNGEEEVVFIKNKELTIHYLSPEYQNRFLTPISEILLKNDKTDEDYEQDQKKIDIETLKQDELIRDTKVARNFLYVDIYDRILLIHKRPIINPDTKNFVGILGLVRPFNMPNILRLIYKMNGIKFGLVNKTSKENINYELTERQSMVLFLYLNKYSNAEIADIMSILGHKISKSRVNDHLENLKYIFQTKTKEQLIEKAIAMNYHHRIPRKFLRAGSYEFEDELIICE